MRRRTPPEVEIRRLGAGSSLAERVSLHRADLPVPLLQLVGVGFGHVAFRSHGRRTFRFGRASRATFNRPAPGPRLPISDGPAAKLTLQA